MLLYVISPELATFKVLNLPTLKVFLLSETGESEKKHSCFYMFQGQKCRIKYVNELNNIPVLFFLLQEILIIRKKEDPAPKTFGPKVPLLFFFCRVSETVEEVSIF